jgi:hypothetical protein
VPRQRGGVFRAQGAEQASSELDRMHFVLFTLMAYCYLT